MVTIHKIITMLTTGRHRLNPFVPTCRLSSDLAGLACFIRFALKNNVKYSNPLIAPYTLSKGLWASIQKTLAVVVLLAWLCPNHSVAQSFDQTIHTEDLLISLKLWTKKGGVPLKRGLDAKCIHVLPDSLIRFATVSGVVEAVQETVNDQSLLRDTSILWLHKDRRNTCWACASKGIYNLATSTSYLDTMNGQPLVVEWRVPSQSKLWQKLNEENEILLLNLPYGAFDVEVRAWSYKSKRDPIYASLSFHKAYPVYRYTTFWLWILLAITGLLLLLHRWRSKEIHAKNLELEAMVQKRTQELEAQVENLLRNQERRRAYLSAQPLPKPSEAKSDHTVEEQEVVGYDEAWLQELEAIVRKNLSKLDFKIADIAFQLHVSERTLRYRIKAYTGLTPSAYLQKARLDKAYRSIKNREYKTVSEVAYAVGFKDARYFSKIFKRAYGKLPSDYL